MKRLTTTAVYSLILTAALPLFARSDEPAGAITTGGPVSPAGVRATADLPAHRHVRNTGGSDGAGLCVFTSVQMSGDWQHLPQLAGLQKYMTRFPGGGYPEKLDSVIAAYCREKQIPTPGYVQHTGGDDSFLDLAVKTGRMPAVTYAGADGFYSGPVAHMVNLTHLDATAAAIVDNNRPGKWVWMTRREFLNRWRGQYDDGRPMTVREGGRVFQVGGGWAVALLAPPPPPYPAPPATADVDARSLPEVKNYGIALAKLSQNQPPAAPPKESNFGIDVARVNRRAAYSINGADVPKAAAEAALSDDSGKPSVTFVGEFTAPADLPVGVKDRVHVQHYRPSDWAVGQFGLLPGLTVRKPAVNRVGAELGHIGAEAAMDPRAVEKLVADSLAGPKPPPVDPLPSPVRVSFSLADFSEAGKKKLADAGVSKLEVNAEIVPPLAPPPRPAAEPQPMPAKADAPPAGLTPPGPNYSWRHLPGVGFGWVQDGVTAATVQPRTPPTPAARPVYPVPYHFPAGGCANGRCSYPW